MNRFHTLCAIVVTIFFNYSHAANPNYIWTDTTGLVPAGVCESKALTSHPPKSVLDLSSDVIEITDLTERLQENNIALVGSFWQAVSEDGHPVTATCPQVGVSGILFEVHHKSSKEPLSIVAAADSSLFHFVKTHSVDEAEILFNSVTRTPSSQLTEGVSAFEGSFQNVLCSSNSENRIYSDDLKTVLFTAAAYDNVQLVQSWDTHQKIKEVKGQKISFIKVQILQSSGLAKIGWVEESYIRPRPECLGTETIKSSASRATTWTFPTIKRATQNYKTGMRRFKASRSGGRLHAACDLYRIKGETVLAVTSGTVIRDRYYFYEGTYALEVKHDGGKVVRYGEVTGSAATGVSLGKTVKAGQTVGYVGKVNSNCCEPMLHFEMYSGTKTGSLTQSGNSFRRRSDLLDPSAYLTEWEKAKFGTNY